MEKEHTPAKTTQGRTTFRFTQADATEALIEWLARNFVEVPDGRTYVEQWTITLIVVDHPDPPPTRKDVKNET